ncbi:MAG: hypothetical protein IJ379_01570 [Lachnospiraceae bacterium]|nr:hypothetical protein [Lachnospiraceae bacterium]
MKKERLIKETPTAQVRLLAEERLSDGKPHSRKDITEYVKEQGKLMGLPVFREGHMAGGIREATTNLECEKVGRAVFQMNADVQVKENISEVNCWKQAAEVCEGAQSQLTVISRNIDFVTAGTEELAGLNKLRECVQLLKEYQEIFEKY